MRTTLTQNVAQNDRISRQLVMQLNHRLPSCSSGLIAKVHSSGTASVSQISCSRWLVWHNKCAREPSNTHINDSRNSPYPRGSVISKRATLSEKSVFLWNFPDTFFWKSLWIFPFFNDLFLLFFHISGMPQNGYRYAQALPQWAAF